MKALNAAGFIAGVAGGPIASLSVFVIAASLYLVARALVRIDDAFAPERSTT